MPGGLGTVPIVRAGSALAVVAALVATAALTTTGALASAPCDDPAVIAALERQLFTDMRRLDAGLRRVPIADVRYGQEFLDVRQTGEVADRVTCEAAFGFAYVDPRSGQTIQTPGRVTYSVDDWPKGLATAGAAATGDGEAHGLVTTAGGEVLILRKPVTRVTATFKYG